MIRHVFLSQSAPGRSGPLSNDGCTAGRLKAEAHVRRTPGPGHADLGVSPGSATGRELVVLRDGRRRVWN